MKTKELKAMNEEELDKKTAELRTEMMKINSQIATGTVPKSPGKVREIKRTIAKILTVKKENKVKQELKKRKPAKTVQPKGGSKKE